MVKFNFKVFLYVNPPVTQERNEETVVSVQALWSNEKLTTRTSLTPITRLCP